ncbi:MAG TPA: acylphosphatase [Azospira sp.]|nr:acylphosphatase [Azospira sp.]
MVRLTVRGLVQGVGFRWSLCREAEALGLQGWVRNRSDGSVEALARGEAEAVGGLIAWAGEGPPAARVTALEVAEVREAAWREHHPTEGFEQRPTL